MILQWRELCYSLGFGQVEINSFRQGKLFPEGIAKIFTFLLSPAIMQIVCPSCPRQGSVIIPYPPTSLGLYVSYWVHYKLGIFVTRRKNIPTNS